MVRTPSPGRRGDCYPEQILTRTAALLPTSRANRRADVDKADRRMAGRLLVRHALAIRDVTDQLARFELSSKSSREEPRNHEQLGEAGRRIRAPRKNSQGKSPAAIPKPAHTN